MSDAATIDPRRFRETLGHYPTGVVIVTAVADDGAPVGMVVGSFTSVSLDPPLIAYLPTRSSSTYARLATSSSFCVNVLAHDQGDLCRRFAGRSDDKFAGVGWTESSSGSPILDGAVAWIDCDVEAVTDGGDHHIVLGRVRDLDVVNPAAPLLFFQGGYGRFAPLSLVAPADSDLIAGVQLAELVRQDMEDLAADLRAECTAMSAVGPDLALVASAAGPGVSSTVMLGTRIPLMPPLGELYVAWEGAEAADRWLARAGTVDEETREQYVQRLRAARERGWSISMVGQDGGGDLADYLLEYSTGAALTPAREREINAAIARTAKQYEPVDLVDDQLYDVNSLVAPVVGANGRVQLVLRLSQLPRQATGERVQRWVERLLEAAARAGETVSAAERRGAVEIPEPDTHHWGAWVG